MNTGSKPKIAETFDRLYTKYKSVLSLSELNNFAKQLEECGYDLAIERTKKEIRTQLGINDSIGAFKKICADELGIDLALTPAQRVMYK